MLHSQACKKILRYCANIQAYDIFYKLRYGEPNHKNVGLPANYVSLNILGLDTDLVFSADADITNCTDYRQSVLGYMLCVNSGPIT